jgi:hypothetical protein
MLADKLNGTTGKSSMMESPGLLSGVGCDWSTRIQKTWKVNFENTRTLGELGTLGE